MEGERLLRYRPHVRTNTALLQSLGRHLEQTAEKRDVALEALTEQVLSAVKLAVEQHFGPKFRFEVRLEEGRLEVLQVVTLVATPARAGEVALSSAPAEWNAEAGDELMFLLPFDEHSARAQDREYSALSGLTVEKSGFVTPVLNVVRELLGLKHAVDPVDEAVLLAMKLTAMPEAARSDPSSWDSYRLAHDARSEAAQLFKRFVVGQDLTRAELNELLERDDVPDGGELELFVDLLSLEALLLGLTSPFDPLSRAAERFEVEVPRVADRLGRLGLDVRERTMNGRAWTNLPIEHSWMEFAVVEHVTDPYGEMTLENARRLDPSLTLGAQVRLPSLTGAHSLFEVMPGVEAARTIDTLGAASFEAVRGLVAVMPTPEALAPFALGTLRRLYPEDHGVLLARVPGGEAELKWRQLDEAAQTTGYRPVLLRGDAGELRSARFAWQQERVEGLQQGTHPMTDPSIVLASSEQVDVEALLRRGGNPSYPDLAPTTGDWPEHPPTTSLGAVRDLLTKALLPEVQLALVPTDAAWKALAFMPMLTQAGEATPSLAQAVAVSRHWEARHGAKVIAVGPAMIEWLAPKTLSRADALTLAEAHFAFTPEGASDVLEHRAAELMTGFWFAWWD